MSGVVGVLSTDRAPIDLSLVTGMTAAMAFRGPDGQETWVGGRMGLGHALLRTTARSPGEAQPDCLDGDVWITADARLDRRAHLCRRLRERGCEVAADTPDARLILHAYRAWGDRFLDDLFGDFAFVLWDDRRQRLLAARDQLGIGQLFYTQVDGLLLLGNTLHSLFAHPSVSDSLNEHTLADVATSMIYLDDAATGYAAVRRVPPAHTLTWDERGLRVQRYWELRRPTPLRYRRAQDYSEHFRALFDEAVSDRLRTPCVGTQLSGGMDSTSIAVTAREQLEATGQPFDLRGYTIEYRSLIPDEEGTLAARVGAHAGFPVEVVTGEDTLGAAPAAKPAWVPPEPGAATLWEMSEVCRRTASFARVLLAGYGGDPLLSAPGLAWHRTSAALSAGDWKWPLRGLAAEMRRRGQNRRERPLPAWANPSWARDIGVAERASLLGQRSRRDQLGLVEAPLWRTLFAWSDPGYSGTPLDIRFPFFDLRLVDFVLAIPPVPWLQDKLLLRDAMGERLPDVIRMRPKTVMPGNVALERNKRLGVPAWEIDIVAGPEMERYVDAAWLRRVRCQSASERAYTWSTDRPPIQLAYWLRHRPCWHRQSPVPARLTKTGDIRGGAR